jgi:hypothetical protein
LLASQLLNALTDNIAVGVAVKGKMQYVAVAPHTSLKGALDSQLSDNLTHVLKQSTH